jgi:hypothetical protein
MWVTTSSFVNAGNNGHFLITAATGGASGTFTCTTTTQITETHAASAVADGLVLTFTPTPLNAGIYIVVFASKQVSAGTTTAFKGSALIYAGAGADSSPVSILSNYVGKYGNLVTGRKIQAAAFTINSVNGAATKRMNSTATVA